MLSPVASHLRPQATEGPNPKLRRRPKTAGMSSPAKGASTTSSPGSGWLTPEAALTGGRSRDSEFRTRKRRQEQDSEIRTPKRIRAYPRDIGVRKLLLTEIQESGPTSRKRALGRIRMARAGPYRPKPGGGIASPSDAGNSASYAGPSPMCSATSDAGPLAQISSPSDAGNSASYAGPSSTCSATSDAGPLAQNPSPSDEGTNPLQTLWPKEIDPSATTTLEADRGLVKIHLQCKRVLTYGKAVSTSTNDAQSRAETSGIDSDSESTSTGSSPSRISDKVESGTGWRKPQRRRHQSARANTSPKYRDPQEIIRDGQEISKLLQRSCRAKGSPPMQTTARAREGGEPTSKLCARSGPRPRDHSRPAKRPKDKRRLATPVSEQGPTATARPAPSCDSLIKCTHSLFTACSINASESGSKGERDKNQTTTRCESTVQQNGARRTIAWPSLFGAKELVIDAMSDAELRECLERYITSGRRCEHYFHLVSTLSRERRLRLDRERHRDENEVRRIIEGEDRRQLPRRRRRRERAARQQPRHRNEDENISPVRRAQVAAPENRWGEDQAVLWRPPSPENMPWDPQDVQGEQQHPEHQAQQLQEQVLIGEQALHNAPEARNAPQAEQNQHGAPQHERQAPPPREDPLLALVNGLGLGPEAPAARFAGQVPAQDDDDIDWENVAMEEMNRIGDGPIQRADRLGLAEPQRDAAADINLAKENDLLFNLVEQL
ncbi:hypothetical protein QAD02_015860 [Eretmocerus hayati]|uniref:Uncharacterized protein n=1 Tax=Eretmocerus hayati TaxID=131215 RepID=A0ACC2PAG7_9HYME|nr:hypothetical protein QAD02_015860 [Eretmocerus hayati]